MNVLAPYGIREATERVGTEKEDCKIKEEHLSTHIPAKIDYSISNLYRDLLIFSAKFLKIGGRLVVWFPVYRYIHYKRTQLYIIYFINCALSERIIAKRVYPHIQL